jgi:hypothetical protein
LRLVASILLSVVLSLIGPSTGLSKEPNWLLLSNGVFEVYTDASEKKARKLLLELERFRVASEALLMLEPPKYIDTPPVVVVLFRLSRDYANVAPKDTAGFALRRYDDTYLVMPVGSKEAKTVVRHEYVHAIMRYTMKSNPKWYEEGVAEFLAYSKIKGNSMRIGLPPRNRTGTPQKVPLGLLVSDDYRPSNRYEGNSAYRRYWLLTHYLMLGNPQLQDELNRYLSLWDSGTPSVPAFTRAFGMTPDEFYTVHLKGYTRIPTADFEFDTAQVRSDFTTEPADPKRVAKILQTLSDHAEIRQSD